MLLLQNRFCSAPQQGLIGQPARSKLGRCLLPLCLAASLGFAKLALANTPLAAPPTLNQTKLPQKDSIARAIQQDRFDFPPPNLPQAKALKLWATHYYVHQTKALPKLSDHNSPQPKGQSLLNEQGQAISDAISEKDFCLGAVEGSILIQGLDGQQRLYNYHSKANQAQIDCAPFLANKAEWVSLVGRTRFRMGFGPYGDGLFDTATSGNILVPFRSIAVDPTFIAPGSLIFIPKARGQAFPDTQGKMRKHDGYFFASDVGYALKGNHVDIFGGLSDKNPFPHFVTSQASDLFDAFLVESSTAKTYLQKLHRFGP